jgi:hypothetical protein
MKQSEQRKELEQLLNNQPNDLHLLRAFAKTQDGFLNDSFRQRIYPLLLNIKNNTDISTPLLPETLHQIQVDVERAHFFNMYSNASVLDIQRQKLTRIIHHVLEKNPQLFYYQGFHELCATLLMILGEEKAKQAAYALSLFWLRDSMQKTIQPTLAQIRLLMRILYLKDSKLHHFLSHVEGLEPFYCLSWVLTWCSHDISNYSSVARLFDVFITTNPLMPIYLVAACLHLQRDLILNQDPTDFPVIHSKLTVFPSNDELPLESIIERAYELLQEFPPKKLQKRGFYLSKFSSVNTFTYDCLKSKILDAKLGQKRCAKLAADVEKRRMVVFGDRAKIFLYSGFVALFIAWIWGNLNGKVFPT